MAEVRFLPQTRFEQVETRFDVEHGVYWAFMNPRPRPCFNTQLLRTRAYIDTTVDNDCQIPHLGQVINQLWRTCTETPGVFNSVVT
jgi:hypothetical protein